MGDTKTAEVIDGTLCDLVSANAIILVFEALAPKLQDTAQRLSFELFGQFAWKHVS